MQTNLISKDNRWKLSHYKRKLDKYDNLPRLCFFKNSRSTEQEPGVFKAVSASGVEGAQFAASLVLVARPGTCEELEVALELPPALDLVNQTLLDPSTPETLRGLIRRLINNDFKDTSEPSLILAYKIKKLRLEPTVPRRTARITNRPCYSTAAGSDTSSSSKVDDDEYRGILNVLTACEQTVNKVFIDILEVICPAHDGIEITIADDEREYKVQGGQSLLV